MSPRWHNVEDPQLPFSARRSGDFARSSLARPIRSSERAAFEASETSLFFEELTHRGTRNTVSVGATPYRENFDGIDEGRGIGPQFGKK